MKRASLPLRRRQFISLLGSAATAWTFAAAAQQKARVYRLGFLTTASGPTPEHGEFESALARLGYQDGRNLLIERRYAARDLGRLPELAADLVRANVDVIVTQTTPAAFAAKQATAAIPIVMATSGDAVGSGLVASLARPGGNVTGLTFLGTDLSGKRLELLRDLKPGLQRVAYLGNGAILPEQLSFRELLSVATALGMMAEFVDVRVSQDFEAAFTAMAAHRADAMMVAESVAFMEVRSRIIELAARHWLPAVYGRREFTDDGGLVSYGTSFADLFRRAATFVDKIFRGRNPADLPVEQPTKFELVINLRTARALGITVPPKLLASADEVIE